MEDFLEDEHWVYDNKGAKKKNNLWDKNRKKPKIKKLRNSE